MVQYGSAGFSTHGYHAGCPYGRANAARVLADNTTERLLCEPELTATCNIDECVDPLLRVYFTSDEFYTNCLDDKPPACSRCLADYSGTGMCRQTRLDNGFVFAKPVRRHTAAAVR